MITLEEKIKRVVAIIDEALIVQKTNPVYVPTAYFKPENLGFPTPRDVFRILRESGAMKEMQFWWGYDTIEDGKQRFVKTDSEEPINDDDFEVYEIEVDKTKWLNAKRLSVKKDKGVLMLSDFLLNNDGLIYSKSSPDIRAKFGKGTARHQILKTLVGVSGNQVQTDMLREVSRKKTNRNVQKEIGAIKARIAKMLGIKNPKKDEIIEGEEYSGYKLKIKIKLE